MNTNTSKTVLVVDDEEDLRHLVSVTLTRMGLEPIAVGSVKEAKQALGQQPFHLCLTDMNLPDGNGIELVQHIKRHHNIIPVAMITAYGNMETATLAMKEGAYDFIAKPISLPRLRHLVEDGLSMNQAANLTNMKRLIGTSEKIEELRANIDKFARSQAPIYIDGELGTGKQRIAHLVHQASPRREKPFIHFSCAGFSNDQLEAELFGQVRQLEGRKIEEKGAILSANGGTLYLEDINEIPLNLQLQLLRALEDKSLRPSGYNQDIPFNVRVISSSHQPLTQALQEKRFRQDLFYRLNVIELTLPTLRSRTEDIALLAEYYLAQLANYYQEDAKQLNQKAIDALQLYSFPGNLQELENILERAATLADGLHIDPRHLKLPEAKPAVTTEPVDTSIENREPGRIEAYRPAEQPLEDYLQDIERREILAALDSTLWNRTAAAKRLGMSFRSLRYRLKKLGIDQGGEED